MGYVNGELVFNPTISMMADSSLDLRMAGTEDAILMVEAGAQEVPEDLLVRALREGHAAIQDTIRVQKQMAEEVGKPKREMIVKPADEELLREVETGFGDDLRAALQSASSKEEVSHAIDSVRVKVTDGIEDPERARGVAVEQLVQRMVRARILTTSGRTGATGADSPDQR